MFQVVFDHDEKEPKQGTWGEGSKTNVRCCGREHLRVRAGSLCPSLGQVIKTESLGGEAGSLQRRGAVVTVGDGFPWAKLGG